MCTHTQTESNAGWRLFQWRLCTVTILFIILFLFYWTSLVPAWVGRCFLTTLSKAEREWLTQTHPDSFEAQWMTGTWVSPLFVQHCNHYIPLALREQRRKKWIALDILDIVIFPKVESKVMSLESGTSLHSMSRC